MSAKVTILLAAYKGNTYVPAMIDSILKQDCDDWQLILSDDGGFTEEVLDSYAARYPEKITHHKSGKRFGSAQKHFLYLCSLVPDADYIMFCDQDDVWHPDKVRRTLALMEETEKKHPGPVLVHTDLKVVDGELNEMCPSFMTYSRLCGSALSLRELLVQNVVTGCTVMINGRLNRLGLKGAGNERMLMHDWWLALCAAAFGKAAFLPAATMDYRQHGGNVVGAKNPRSLGYIFDKIRGGRVKKALVDTAGQAAAFLACYEDALDEEQKAVLGAFAAVPGQGKLARLRTYARFGLWKKDLKRRIGQILWW